MEKGLTKGYEVKKKGIHRNVPAALVGKAIAQAPHVIADRRPFRAADDANVFDGQYRKEQILVCSVIPVLVHCGRNVELEEAGMLQMVTLNLASKHPSRKIGKNC